MKEHSPVVYPFIFVLVHTGARRNEILDLKWQDVNFRTGLLHIRNTKNGEPRSIRMGANLAAYLEAMPKQDEFIFLNQKATQLGRYQVDGTIESLQRKYRGMKGWRCHDLRHSFAYNYLKRGGEMYALKAILGHKSIQLTVDLYGHYRACDVSMTDPYED